MEILIFFNYKIQKIIVAISLFFFCFNTFAQTQVDKIYNSLDIFVANPTIKNLEILEKQEKTFAPKTKDELLAIVILDCNKAYYQNQFGRTQNAISSYEKAWQIYQINNPDPSGSNLDITENCLIPLGNLYTKIGDFENAENTIKQYYFIAETNKNVSQKVTAIVNLSNVTQNTGRINLAISLLESTLKTEKLNASQQGILLSSLGANYLLVNQINKAKSNIEKAIKILKNQKNENQYLSNCYKNLATVYYQNKDFKNSDANFQTALNYASKIEGSGQKTAAKNYYDYALLSYNMKNYDKANEYISLVFNNLITNFNVAKEEIPQQQFLYADNVLLDALDLKAELFTLQSQPKKALKTYNLCQYIEDLFSNLLVYENSKIINQIRVRNRVEKCIGIYEFLYQTEKKPIYLETAFTLSDQSKLGVLKNYKSLFKNATAEEKTLLQKLQNINNEIIKEQQKLNYADLDKINNLIQQQNQTMLLLKNSQSKSSNIENKTINLSQLFSKLNDDNSSFIEYFVGQNTIYAFVLNNNKITLKSIENSEINKNKITNFIDYFASADVITNDISGYNNSAFEVYKTFFFPPENTKNIIIVPDGLLNFVPFEALITKVSTTTNFAKMNYLMNDFAIGYNNSASFYLNSKPLKNDQSVLGIFPVFAKTNYELVGSKAEMKSIKNRFNGEFLDNSNANFSNFKQKASRFSILHLSTHADGGGIDVPATIKFYDREVLYSELYNLDINPNLVVLSACQTGIGKLYKSEGAMSVARGFQYAGAENLLFSLWKVNDYTTSVFMDDFYKNIENSNSYLNANNKAKHDFLADKSISNAKNSPYYWAAFVYYGSLEQPKNNYLYWIIGGVFALLGLLFGWWFFRKFFNLK